MSEEESWDPATLSYMMRVVELVRQRGQNAFSQFGANDTRSFLIGLICGCAAFNGMGARETMLLLRDPNVQAMIDGACLEDEEAA